MICCLNPVFVHIGDDRLMVPCAKCDVCVSKLRELRERRKALKHKQFDLVKWLRNVD